MNVTPPVCRYLQINDINMMKYKHAQNELSLGAVQRRYVTHTSFESYS